MNQRGCASWLGYLLLWVGLSTLAAFALWQAHVVLLYLAALIIDNPRLRPVGWSTMSLVGVSKLSILFWPQRLAALIFAKSPSSWRLPK